MKFSFLYIYFSKKKILKNSKKKKCSFDNLRTECVGHVVIPEGVSPYQDKIRVVQAPTNLKEIKKDFSGLVNYFQYFQPLECFDKEERSLCLD